MLKEFKIFTITSLIMKSMDIEWRK